MKCSIHKPSAPLSDHVMCIWNLEHRHKTGESCIQRMVPTGYMEIELYYGGCTRIRERNGAFSRQPPGLVCGQKNRFRDFEFSGDLGVVTVVVHPWAARALCGLPARLLFNSHISLEDIYGTSGSEIIDRITESDNDRERFDLVENFLIKRLNESSRVLDPCVADAVTQISRCGGDTRVSDVARQLKISRRQLERKFASDLGISPKSFMKSIRFQHTLALKQKNDEMSLTELAYASGYSDQAHFINDFKSITGHTPKVYFRIEEAFSEFYAFSE